jgi:hypothetical protein
MEGSLKLLNPTVVRVPDGRVGCLVGRVDLDGYVEFSTKRRPERYKLTVLNYMGPTRYRRKADKS